ncbi:MAG TPA: hypothetical protein VKN63_07815, partial [Afifellaceae bacterium]|nr:hypothetical protein [Afifellaceae bacterium]
MSLFYLLYLVLLVAWFLLIHPAFRAGRFVRLWLLFVILAGVAALIHEIRIYFFTTEAIRVEILLFSVILLVLYGVTTILLFITGRRWPAALLGLVLLVTGAGMSVEAIKLQRETARLTELFRQRNALLFEAKFRNLQTYRSYFGPLERADTPFPAGHWQPRETGYYKRLIVNADGDAWLFYSCGETECALQNKEAGLEPADDGSAQSWQVELHPPAGMMVPATISRQGPDGLLVASGERQATFLATPPPVGSGPDVQMLTYLGTFADTTCRNQHADVRQVWLWRQDDRLFAVAILSTLVAGRTSRFVEPLVLGEGERDGETWTYAWQQNGQDWQAS